MIYQDFVVGDTLKVPSAKLMKLVNGISVDYDLTGSVVKFRMVSASAPNTVKVNDSVAVIDSAAEGLVHYEWQTSDIDSSGYYLAYWIIEIGGARETIPKKPEYGIIIHPADGTKLRSVG